MKIINSEKISKIFSSMQFVSKKFDDRVTLLAGCISLTAVLLTVIGTVF